MNMIIEDPDMLKSLADAERKAGEAILGVYNSALKVELKADSSPVNVHAECGAHQPGPPSSIEPGHYHENARPAPTNAGV